MNNGPQQIPVLVAMFDSGCSFNYGGSRTAHHITIADTVQQGDCHTLLSPDPATNTEQFDSQGRMNPRQLEIKPGQ